MSLGWIHALPRWPRLALLAALGAAVGALCVFGGLRLVAQHEWGWGTGVAAAGVLMLVRSVQAWNALRGTPAPPPRPDTTRDGAPPPAG